VPLKLRFKDRPNNKNRGPNPDAETRSEGLNSRILDFDRSMIAALTIDIFLAANSPSVSVRLRQVLLCIGQIRAMAPYGSIRPCWANGTKGSRPASTGTAPKPQYNQRLVANGATNRGNESCIIATLAISLFSLTGTLLGARAKAQAPHSKIHPIVPEHLDRS